MARKDKILTAGALYVSTNWKTDIPNVLIECFEKGADWADEHPLPPTDERVKVRIRISGEADATIVREMTKKEYEFFFRYCTRFDLRRRRIFSSIIRRYFKRVKYSAEIRNVILAVNYGKEENIKRIDKRSPYAEFL